MKVLQKATTALQATRQPKTWINPQTPENGHPSALRIPEKNGIQPRTGENMKTRLGPQIVITNENGFHENQQFQPCLIAAGLVVCCLYIQ